MDGFVNLPNNLYNGGAAVFNSAPYINFIMQANQRRQAKKDALDNYYRELNSNLTSKGMDNKDVPDWMNKVSEWQDYVSENRGVLNNPRDKNYGDVYTTAQKLYNDAGSFSESSKQKIADLNKFNELRLSHPDYPVTDAGMLQAHNASLPLTKGYQPLDWSKIEYTPKPFDLEKYQKQVIGSRKMSEQQPTITTNPKTALQTIITKSAYTPEDLDAMASTATYLYQHDSGLYKEVNSMMKDHEMYNALNKKFKDIYGENYNIILPEEMTAALLLPQKETTDTKTQNDPVALEAIKNKYDTSQKFLEDKLIRARKDDNQSETNNTIDQMVDNQIAYAKQSNQWGNPITLPVDPATLKSLNVSRLILSPNGKEVIPVTNYVSKDAKGNDVVTPTQGTPFTIEQYKAAIGKRNIGKDYFKKTSTSSPKQGKTYNIIDPNTGQVIGVVDSEDAANKAAKKGYKVE